jgi:hypothetical protein
LFLDEMMNHLNYISINNGGALYRKLW